MAVATVLVAVDRPAFASGGELPVRVDYAAPAVCPDRDALLAHVRARTASIRVANATESALELVVRVEAIGGQFRGRLVLAPSSGNLLLQEREIVDAKCDDLIEALGFFIALSIDAKSTSDSGAASEPPAAGTPAPEPVPAPPASAEPSAPVAEAPPSRNAPGPPSERVQSDVEPPQGAAAGPSRWHLGGGAGAALVGGVSRRAQLASRFAFELVRDVPANGIALSPSFSVAAMSTATTTESSALGAIALRWQALVGTACPLALTISGVASVRPCAFVEAGRLRGEGVGISAARRNDAEWIAVGLSGRLDVEIAPKLFLEVDVGAASPLVRPRFSYASGTVAFDTPASGGRVGLTLAFVP